MSQFLKEYLEQFPNLSMSILPTPIHKLEFLSRKYTCDIYCKRDDLTGFAFGGNKIRKLDYLLMDALNQKCDTIVTNGSNQSNWCRMTATAGAANMLEVHLVLAGKKPGKNTANLLLDELVGANIHHLDTNDDALLERVSMELVEKLKRQGKHPYYMSVGGSNSIGALGYIKAFQEILEYSNKSGISFSKIYMGSGSAGTQAGLVVGQLLSRWKGLITGINVSRSKSEQEEKVKIIVEDTLRLLNVRMDQSIWNKRVVCDDNYLGEGYRKNTEDARQAIELFARKEGIFLDEVYTGKAAAGLIDHLEKALIPSNENILFIHTGGNVQLFE
ncbi:MAG: D-cysteine desulfhydrase family protein [Bacteroidota bacterium]|nr:D-cysteine desulfhydrase family protein [Bacteroidota bacterium]